MQVLQVRAEAFSVKKKPDTVLVVVGPTASGKSSFACNMAQRLGGVIFCADSIQLYDGLPLLTAQPTEAQKKAAPHRLYGDLSPIDPEETVASWCQRLAPLLDETFENGKTPIVVGGTGFYIKALTEGIAPMPHIPKETVQRLSMEKTADLWAALQEADPNITNTLKPTDRQRIIRALSVVRETGRSLLEWQKCLPKEPKFTFDIIHVDPPFDLLKAQIQKRFHEMWAEGVCQEVKDFTGQFLKQNRARGEPVEPLKNLEDLTAKDVRSLLKEHGFKPEAWPPVTKALGFAELLLFSEGMLTQEQVQQLVIRRTNQYAKRQRTWFRHQLPTSKAHGPKAVRRVLCAQDTLARENILKMLVKGP